MNVEVTLNNNTKIFPSYDPEHALEIFDFYAKQYLANLIQGYRITDNNGNLVAMNGAN